MDDRFNTAAGWVLFSGIVALGLSSLSAKYFMADKHHAPHEMGYPVEGAADEGGDANKGPSLAELLASGDVAKGEKAAKARCGTCHTFDQGGANGTGPNLYGTVGEDIGHGKRGFAFSSALADHGGKWSYENLDAWLTSPKAFAAGTKMSFAGLSKGEDRANIILYLRSLGGGPELPTPEAKPAEGDEAAPADAASDAPAGEDAKAAEAAPAEAAPAK
ncbi:c-type cytochrome [Tsuneonella flava]|uniref:C-type cytochrome n=1 Tax=Tsuneonella flava TaxID=2055955 RepID=A0ABX7KB27_9SPHN|nr:c-type cytochrome [Tsuneonella flava]QSB44381.1 c-type cytochrome [Tsuneonella flava]